MKTTKQEFLIKSKLLERGWTDTMIGKFLPEPDLTKRNPHYAKAAPMKLYFLERVEQIEATEQFNAEKDKSAVKKQAARKAVSTKVAKTMQYVEQEVKIKVPRIARKHLLAIACRSYNDWQSGSENWDGSDGATKNSDPLFLQRICVNYLRHEMTEYDFYLGQVHGKVGIGDAYFAIRKKIFTAIAEVYPWLAEECKRQQGEE